MGWLEQWRGPSARARGHGTTTVAGHFTAGPTHHEPKRLAAELRDLAGHPLCAVHGDALRRLADAVSSGSEDELRMWAGGGLVAAYCGPDALTAVTSPTATESGRARRLLHALPSVLVFTPLLVTWAGLGAAAYAYQRMRDSGGGTGAGAGPSESFLTLWQQGFDGHLWPVLHFDMMIVYTVVALLALMGTTVLSRLRDVAEETERRLIVPRLSGALAQVEALAARAAHSSPPSSPRNSRARPRDCGPCCSRRPMSRNAHTTSSARPVRPRSSTSPPSRPWSRPWRSCGREHRTYGSPSTPPHRRPARWRPVLGC